MVHTGRVILVKQRDSDTVIFNIINIIYILLNIYYIPYSVESGS